MANLLCILAGVTATYWWLSGESTARFLVFCGLGYLWVPGAWAEPNTEPMRLLLVFGGLAVVWGIASFPTWVWRQPGRPVPPGSPPALWP